jgi:hypothetical protein
MFDAIDAARSASQSPAHARLCLLTHDGGVQSWSAAKGERMRDVPDARADEVVAYSGGCVARSAHGATSYPDLGPPKTLASERVMALGAGPKDLLLATASAILTFDTKGNPGARYDDVHAVVSIARVGDAIAVGKRDGSLALLVESKADRKAAIAFKDVPSNPPTIMLAGPMGTLLVGYASGEIGMWSTRDGSRLARAHLHGRARHMLIEDQRLYVATDLGAYLVWDLRAFYASYCDLIQDVWRGVQVVWDAGRPVRRQRPDGHRCATP